MLDDPGAPGEFRGCSRVERERAGTVGIQVAPRQSHVGGVLVRLILERLEDGEVRSVLAPRQLPVRRLVRVERADAPGCRIVEPDTVADPILGVDGHGQQAPLLLPSEFRNVAEAHRLAPGQIPNQNIGAAALALLGAVAAERQVPPIIGEGERLHRFDLLPFSRPQVEEADAVAHGVPPLAELFPLVRGDADRVREPVSVRAELGARAFRDDDDGIRVRAVDAKLRSLVHPTDRNGEPEPVRRERRRAQALPAVVVVRAERGFVLRGRTIRIQAGGGDERDGEDGPDSSEDVPHLSISWLAGAAPRSVRRAARDPRPRNMHRKRLFRARVGSQPEPEARREGRFAAGLGTR